MTFLKIKKTHFLLIFITLVLSFLFFIFIYNAAQKEIKNLVFPTVTPVSQDNFIKTDDLFIPKSFMGFSIKSVDEHDPSIENNAIYIDSEPKFLSLDEWVLKRDNIKKEEFEEFKDSVRKFAEFEITKNGWVTDLKLNGHMLKPLSADGPGGGIWGYLKENKGKIQVVLFSQSSISSKKEPINNLNACPCSLRFSIFVSNVTDIETILGEN